MEQGYSYMYVLLAIGASFFFSAGVMVMKKNSTTNISVFFICVLCGIGSTFAAIELFVDVPNGRPPELKTDGNYEVKIVDNWMENGKGWLGVLILTEEGKTTDGQKSKPYRKILQSKFQNAKIVFGIPMTIELKTLPSYQALIVK